MEDIIKSLTGIGTFIPHGHCFLWNPGLLWLNAVSDSLIALSYFSLPAALIYFVVRRRDLAFRSLFVMFGLFILACGMTHAMAVWTIWVPAYWLDGGIKALTAAVSLATAVMIWPLIPHALALPSPVQLRKANTDLERANLQLRNEVELHAAAEARFSGLLESMPDAVVIINADGGIQLVNEQTEQLFGYTRAELLGKEVEVLVPDRLRVSHFHHRRHYFDEPHTRPMGMGLELFGRRKDGSEFPIEVSLSPFKSSDGIVATAIIRDITVRKQVQEQLRNYTAQLEASNNELESFSYSVAHDLRAPLRGIEGFSKILAEDYEDQLDDQGRNYLSRIRAGALRMSQLIDDLLTISRVTRADLNSRTVDLSAMVAAICDELQGKEPERHVDFVIAPDLTVNGDQRLLRIALENILNNAWKFTQHNPSPRIEFGALLQDGKTVYFVRDDGVGFDMAYAGKLFGAFQRLHEQHEFTGTGIGLATVQRIIGKHGGKIWGEAEVGKGATFYFIL